MRDRGVMWLRVESEMIMRVVMVKEVVNVTRNERSAYIFSQICIELGNISLRGIYLVEC